MDEEDACEDWGNAYFTGECTCEHEPEEHGWGSCDECDCEAGWEE